MIGWAIETVMGASALMLLVLAVRRPVADLFGAQWAYALWLLPLLRVVLPPLPKVPVEMPAIIVLPAIDALAAAPAPQAGGAGDWLLLALALWAGGAAIFAIWQQSTYSAFMLHLGPEARSANPASFGGIKVVESDAVDGPVAVGFLDRRIVVPVDFASRYSAAEQRLALEHELVHHRRYDLFWNLAALVLLAVNWFNPIAHFAFRAFRADQELSCDAAVTRAAPEERHDYACALVKSASQPGLIAACPLNHAAFLKRRLKMMKQHRGGLGRTAGGVAAFAIFGVGGLLLSSPGTAQPEEGAKTRVVAARIGREPIIDKRDIATLRAKCGPAEGDGEGIICDRAEARDPEVRAIMARTEKRVREHVAASMPGKAELARIEEAAEKASEQAEKAIEMSAHFDEAHGERIAEAVARAQAAARVDHGRHMAEAREAIARARVQIRLNKDAHRVQVREALQRARAQIAAIDVSAIQSEAMASARAGIAASAITAERRAEIREALNDAREDMKDFDLDLDADMREHDEHLDAEVEQLEPEL